MTAWIFLKNLRPVWWVLCCKDFISNIVALGNAQWFKKEIKKHMKLKNLDIFTAGGPDLLQGFYKMILKKKIWFAYYKSVSKIVDGPKSCFVKII